MLTQIEVHGKKLMQVGKSLQQVNERATGAQSKLEDLTTRMTAIGARSKGFEQIETKIRSLGDSVNPGRADRGAAPRAWPAARRAPRASPNSARTGH
jgi:phage shock protein A